MSDSLDLEFAVTYRHRIFFTEGAFASGNRVLADLFAGAKVIPIVDAGLAQARPGFAAEVAAYGKAMGVAFTRAPLVLTGGDGGRLWQRVRKPLEERGHTVLHRPLLCLESLSRLRPGLSFRPDPDP